MKRIYMTPILALFTALSITATAQVDSGIKITQNQKKGELLDSIKQTVYPYKFPLLGQKLTSRGFLLPYPLGIMLNAYRGSQQVSISDLSIGIDDVDGNAVIPTTSLDDVVKFGEVKANVSNINMRGDVWILPFLDVYGIFGKAWVDTGVNIASILDHPVDISTQAEFDGYVYGWGTLFTGGVRSIFFSLDFNMVWTHFDQMANNNRASNLSLRTGYVFHLNKAERNLAVWTGTGRVFLNNKTIGTVTLSEIAPDFGTNYQNSPWYQDLNPSQQQMADRVVENFVDKNKGDVINYTLSKRPKNNWTMIFGAQYQASRRWQLRTEINVLGGRRSGLLSANYRFGIK